MKPARNKGLQCFILIIALINISSALASSDTAVQKNDKKIKGREIKAMNKIKKSDKEWKAELTPEQYAVTRQQSTEIPFTGKYNHWKEKGVFKCVCCGAVLFDSNHKFDSGTGWPSFWDTAKKENVETHSDKTLGIERTEVLCSQCEAHLGHVFNDGPQPTHLRYCINSAALKFEEKKE